MDEKLTGLGSTREPVTKPQIRLPASRLLLPRSGLERLCALAPRRRRRPVSSRSSYWAEAVILLLSTKCRD